jgi:inosine-uridine nucleoside N-ribohydrolase
MRFLKFSFSLILILSFSISFAQQKVWLDADTGNEMDDLFAIAYLLKSDKIKLIGISSAHFNNADLNVFEKWNAYDASILNPVEESQRLNEEVLAALNRLDIPHPLGADRQIGRAWGQQDPRDSPAAQAIIDAARSIKDKEKLDILTLGAMTNIASALILAPDILPKIRLFSVASFYTPETKIWNKSEFNIRCDLNAFDYLLNLEGLDFTIMTATTSFALKFDRDTTYQMLDETVEIERILAERWRTQNPQDKIRVIWDLALVEAYLFPHWSKVEKVLTPPENIQRQVKVYTEIDAEAMTEEFWKTIKE